MHRNESEPYFTVVRFANHAQISLRCWLWDEKKNEQKKNKWKCEMLQITFDETCFCRKKHLYSHFDAEIGIENARRILLIFKSPPYWKVVMEIGCTQLSLASLGKSTYVLCFGDGKVFLAFFFLGCWKNGRTILHWRFPATQVSDYLPLKYIPLNSAEEHINVGSQPFGFFTHNITVAMSFWCHSIRNKNKSKLCDYAYCGRASWSWYVMVKYHELTRTIVIKLMSLILPFTCCNSTGNLLTESETMFQR